MDMRTTRRKVLPQPERTAALTAIAVAKLRHKYVGIRPRKRRGADTKTAGVVVPDGSNVGSGLAQALRYSSAAWPENNSWELFGSDEFAEFPADGTCDEAGDGYFGDPCVYGEFGTVDEPGWMGGYPG